jgi:bidirectional [NiFe] hydrogenase diaphorase subunit
MVTLTINGVAIQAETGASILEAARANNIDIPSLCYHESVSSYGACRLCLVEVTQGKRKRLVASCLFPVEDGLVIQTDTEEIINIRRMLVELLLERCPDSEVIREMARQLGAQQVPAAGRRTSDKCILCALCARTCNEVVGVCAISLVDRGVNRELATPFYDASDVCIGCGSCAYVCPTGAISCEDVGDKRIIQWPTSKMEFKLMRCRICGDYFLPEKQVQYLAQQSHQKVEELDVCSNCR